MPSKEIPQLEELLQASIGNDLEILEQKSRMLTAPGEHYGSIMLALDVTVRRSNGKIEVLNLVAKLIPVSELLRITFDINVTYKKEVNTYLKAIPALTQLQRDYNVPQHKILDLYPKCYGARINLDRSDRVTEDAVIILENLAVQGYKTGERFVGFDLEHAKIVLEDLAKFHAVPIALRALRPKEFEDKVKPCLIRNTGLDAMPEAVAQAWHNGIYNNSAKIAELQPYLTRVKAAVEKVAEVIKGNAKPRPLNETFATMVHSDYWVNNTMIQYNEKGKPIKNKIVDFQIMNYESAVRDLIFFLYTSVTNSVLDKHYDELISVYHKSFLECLKWFDMDLSKYSWENFLKEIEYVAPQEFYHVTIMFRPIFAEKGAIKDVAEVKEEDWMREDVLGPKYFQKLKNTVIAFADKNWI